MKTKSKQLHHTKGFIYNLDATLAVFIFIFILMASTFLSIRASEDPYGPLQTVLVAKDVVSVMDKQGVLSSFNQTLIESTLVSALPRNIGVHLQVGTYVYNDTLANFTLLGTNEFGDAIPFNGTIYGARRDFISIQGGQVANYSIARLSIWQK